MKRSSSAESTRAAFPPTSSELAPEASIPEWLGAEFDRLRNSQVPLGWVAGVGLLARLWEPQGRRGYDRFEALASGPMHRTIQWLGAQPAWLVELALHQAAARVAELAHGAPTSPQWVLERDDLECAAELLSRAGRGTRLRTLLDALDCRAGLNRCSVELPSGERGAAIARRDPLGWWCGPDRFRNAEQTLN